MSFNNLRTFLLILFLLFFGTTNGYSKSYNIYENLTVTQSEDLIQKNKNNPEFVIIDLRTDGELAQGTIKNAIQLDYMKPGFLTKLRALDKSKTYLIYCQSGYRSEKTFSMMSQLKFDKVYHMNGGFKSWLFLGYPIKN
jgi:rhodanese-related sulfurtransferase